MVYRQIERSCCIVHRCWSTVLRTLGLSRFTSACGSCLSFVPCPQKLQEEKEEEEKKKSVSWQELRYRTLCHNLDLMAFSIWLLSGK